MARLRESARCKVAVAILGVILLSGHWPINAAGEDQAINGAFSPSLTLIIDPDMHTADIHSAAVDDNGQFIATVSADKTLRVWNVNDGKLLQTVHPPSGKDRSGQLYATAIAPGGGLIAVGGWTPGNNIYLVDTRSGNVVRGITEMPNVTTRLAFSPDGRFLAAGTTELRVLDRMKDWATFFTDGDFQQPIYGLAFATDGRLAVASADGRIRLYDKYFKSSLTNRGLAGAFPRSIAFRPPDSRVLAVGYTPLSIFSNNCALDLLDGRTLKSMPGSKAVCKGGSYDVVAWSLDGRTLFASFLPVMSWSSTAGHIVALDNGNLSTQREFSAGSIGGAVTGLAALTDDRLLTISARRPCIAVYNRDGSVRWERRTPIADFGGSESLINIAANGQTVDFRFQPDLKGLRFDVAALKLADLAPDLSTVDQTKQRRLNISIFDKHHPTVDGEPIPIEEDEEVSNVAEFPSGQRFVLSTMTQLYAFKDLLLQWRRFLPAEARALRVSEDGRLVVAAIADGTIRWYRSDNGSELLALTVLKEQSIEATPRPPLAAELRWVVWTPEGFYAAESDTSDVLRWLVNRGENVAGQVVPVSAIPKLLRPDAIRIVLRELDIVRALGVADHSAALAAVQTATGVRGGVGARLHVLTIGIDNYGERAKDFQLRFASKDAEELADVLVGTQKGQSSGNLALYADVKPIHVPETAASKKGIFTALQFLEWNMENGNGQDFAVVMFAGHGVVSGGDLYLLPYGVDPTSTEIELSAIPVSQFRDKVGKLAAHGKVLLLLDACRSGIATLGGSLSPIDADTLRGMFRGNVTVLTSSSGEELSIEDEKWQHGAFTYLILQALRGEADKRGRGLISMIDLVDYLTKNLPALTGNRQHLGTGNLEDFDRDIFVVGR
jgi:WD40 repeat protein